MLVITRASPVGPVWILAHINCLPSYWLVVSQSAIRVTDEIVSGRIYRIMRCAGNIRLDSACRGIRSCADRIGAGLALIVIELSEVGVRYNVIPVLVIQRSVVFCEIRIICGIGSGIVEGRSRTVIFTIGAFVGRIRIATLSHGLEAVHRCPVRRTPVRAIGAVCSADQIVAGGIRVLVGIIPGTVGEIDIFVLIELRCTSTIPEIKRN